MLLPDKKTPQNQLRCAMNVFYYPGEERRHQLKMTAMKQSAILRSITTVAGRHRRRAIT
jgi:hypothetical protein